MDTPETLIARLEAEIGQTFDVLNSVLALHPDCDVEAVIEGAHEQILKALREASVSPPSEGWRDSESAPKDGTEILAWTGQAMCFSCYDTERHAWIDLDDPSERLIQFDFWMPLPAPPASAGTIIAEGLPPDALEREQFGLRLRTIQELQSQVSRLTEALRRIVEAPSESSKLDEAVQAAQVLLAYPDQEPQP